LKLQNNSYVVQGITCPLGELFAPREHPGRYLWRFLRV